MQQIKADFSAPPALERNVRLYWGESGTGKSRRAWLEGGTSVFGKDPRSKFWYGYRGQEMVIFDEFRGGIDIAHLLRWFDRYPVNVEVKGYSGPLMATDIWVTSNLPLHSWFPLEDAETTRALRRRFSTVVHFTWSEDVDGNRVVLEEIE